MRVAASLRFFANTVLLGCCLILADCATPRAARSQGDSDGAQLTSFWRPYLLYVMAVPHPQLYVEVDAVEGCIPSEATLNQLRRFLTAYCNKPGGIQIVRSDVIPLKTARGISPGALARKYINGPPESNQGSVPAFMYVLFYKGGRREKPHVDLLPYPAMIYMNTPYWPKSVQEDLLLHEAGHGLGLAFRPDYASGGHCLDRTCLMNRTIRVQISRLLLGRDPITQHQLCRRCVTQLAESSKPSPPSNLRFVGPVLVRSEAGYHVLSLPDRVKVIVGDLAQQDCRDFAAAVRAETLSGSADAWQAVGTLKAEALREPAKLRELLDRANADPYETVRKVVSRWRVQARIEQYRSSGQLTSAVALLREAIGSNSKDDWSYNQLAWIKATASDASVRDGRAAVSAATQACELTAWKNGNWIDTLAAAYAETGDFTRAIEFEELALRAGDLNASERKEMQGRFLLYKQSRPFRDPPGLQPPP